MQAGQVQTVRGEISPDELGITMMHEHLRLPPAAFWPWITAPDGGRRQDGLAFLSDATTQYAGLGGRTLVDVTASHHQPDPLMLRQLSETTGLNVIMSTGFYKEPLYPSLVLEWDVNDFVAFFVKELTEGAGDTGIKAGIIGEIGTFRHRINPREEKVLRAAARAHLRTGAPISTHATLGTMGLAQLDILEQEGVDLSRVVIGHQDLQSDVDTHEAIINRGAYVQYDTIGKERYEYVIQENRGSWEAAPGLQVEYLAERHYRKDEDRLACLVELINRGHADHIMLSQDLSARESCLNPDTHGEWGYAYLLGSFVPRLRGAGVSEEDIGLMLVENPRRFLRFAV